MPSTPRKTFKTRIHRRVAAATLASFALALGAVTFAGSPLPQTDSAASGTTATTTATAAQTTQAAATTSSSQPVSSSSSGQTSSATLTTSTS